MQSAVLFISKLFLSGNVGAADQACMKLKDSALTISAGVLEMVGFLFVYRLNVHNYRMLCTKVHAYLCDNFSPAKIHFIILDCSQVSKFWNFPVVYIFIYI